jgi:hypothetical protein
VTTLYVQAFDEYPEKCVKKAKCVNNDEKIRPAKKWVKCEKNTHGQSVDVKLS